MHNPFDSVSLWCDDNKDYPEHSLQGISSQRYFIRVRSKGSGGFVLRHSCSPGAKNKNKELDWLIKIRRVGKARIFFNLTLSMVYL